MNARKFLLIGGIILVVVGILGWFLIGPTAEKSIFGATWWFDNAENWAHLILGIVAMILAYTGSMSLKKGVTWVVGILALLVGLYSLMGTKMIGAASLENPADTILHLVVGIWAVWAALKTKGGAMMSSPSSMGGGNNMSSGM